MNDARTPHSYVSARFPHQLEMVRPSRQRLSVPMLPQGYVLRAFSSGDERAYQELFRLAWPEDGTLPHTRAHALAGGFFVVEEDATARLVASCVAFAPEHPVTERTARSAGWSLMWRTVGEDSGRFSRRW